MESCRAMLIMLGQHVASEQEGFRERVREHSGSVPGGAQHRDNGHPCLEDVATRDGDGYGSGACVGASGPEGIERHEDTLGSGP